MPSVITRYYDRAKSVVSGFSIPQRTIALIGVAVLVMGAIALTAWMTRPQMSPLFTGLSAADASAVVEQLKSAGVEYQLTDGGATILVPDDKVYAQRLAAASAGLPSDTSKGYTLLDKMGVTASEFQQSVTYKRAIEGEIANTISAMNGITTASVQLAIPKDSVFVSQKQNPTASVFVKTQAGTVLTDDQVQAIVHLTSASVPGMTADDVTVTDQNGKVLYVAGSGTSGDASKQATQIEARVADSVSKMLDTIVGPGNSTVSVSTDVANSTSERMDETYSAPQNPVSASEQTKTETVTGGSGNGSGVLGPDNIAVPSGGKGSGTYKLEESTKDNPVNKSTQKTVTPAGQVTRQTVSIALDSAAVTGVTAAQVRALVANAAGIDTTRGDTIAVEFVPFSQSGATAAQNALKQAEADRNALFQEQLMRSLIIGGSILLAAIVLGVFIVARRRMKRRVAYTEEGPIEYFATMTENEESRLKELRGLKNPGAIAAPSGPVSSPPTAVLDIEEEPEADQVLVERRRGEIDDFAKADPEATAAALADLMDGAIA